MAGTRTTSATAARAAHANELEPDIRSLLDHIAVELAEEYVRMMETAAHAESSAGSDQEDEES